MFAIASDDLSYQPSWGRSTEREYYGCIDICLRTKGKNKGILISVRHACTMVVLSLSANQDTFYVIDCPDLSRRCALSEM